MANHYNEIDSCLRAFTDSIQSVMLTDWKIKAYKIFGDPEDRIYRGLEAVSTMTAVGKLKIGGWKTTVVVALDKNVMSFSVQLPRGRGSYHTDILARFATEDVIREYAEHALIKLLKHNDAIMNNLTKTSCTNEPEEATNQYE